MPSNIESACLEALATREDDTRLVGQQLIHQAHHLFRCQCPSHIVVVFQRLRMVLDRGNIATIHL